jgi:hypothetical protein
MPVGRGFPSVGCFPATGGETPGKRQEARPCGTPPAGLSSTGPPRKSRRRPRLGTRPQHFGAKSQDPIEGLDHIPDGPGLLWMLTCRRPWTSAGASLRVEARRGGSPGFHDLPAPLRRARYRSLDGGFISTARCSIMMGVPGQGAAIMDNRLSFAVLFVLGVVVPLVALLISLWLL